MKSSIEDMYRIPALLIAVALVAACGQKDAARPAATQVAATVDKSEITVHQINGALARSGVATTAEQAPAARAQVLEQLIEQELLVQQAGSRKLERNPGVVQALEAARRQVLAQALMEEITSAVASPSAEEVRRFYTEHPALFAQRRVFRLREVTVPAAQPEQSRRVAAIAEKARGMDELVALLKTQSLPFSDNVSTKTAEQITIHLLPRFSQLKPDELLVVPGIAGPVIVQVLESQAAPVPESQATPFIEQYLVNQKKLQLAQNEAKRLREQAKIAYLGEFQASPAASAARATEPPASGTDNGLRGLR